MVVRVFTALLIASAAAHADEETRLVLPSAGIESTVLSSDPAPAEDRGTALLNGSFVEFRPSAGRTVDDLNGDLREAESRRAMESLERARILDNELVRVRRALEEQRSEEQRQIEQLRTSPIMKSAQGTEGLEQPAVQPPTASRLLASIQPSSETSATERARMAAVRESLSRQQRPSSRFAASTGGTAFHASLEFNRSIRGTARPASGGDTIRGSRSVGEGPMSEAARIASTTPSTETIPDSVLLRHRPRYSDSQVDGKAAALPADAPGYSTVLDGAKSGILNPASSAAIPPEGSRHRSNNDYSIMPFGK